MGEPVVETPGRRGSSRRREASSISSRRASLIPLNRVLRRFMQARAFVFFYSPSASQPPQGIQVMAGWLGERGRTRAVQRVALLDGFEALHKPQSVQAFKTDLSRRKKL